MVQKKKGKMVLELDHAIGDKVWIQNPESVRKVTSSNCLACKGKGRVKLADRKFYSCPNCHGSGKLKKVEYNHKPISGTIKKIQITESPACGVNGRPDISVLYAISNPKARGCHNKTGFYVPDRIFKTKKACQEQIDHGNG